MTCGDGEIVRSRECIVYEPGTESMLCENYNGSDEVEVQVCGKAPCTTGDDMVDVETEKARDAGVEDNLFLSRYSQAVTLNGQSINTDSSTTTGFGTWRLREDQFAELLAVPNTKTYSRTISTKLLENYKTICGTEHASISLDEATQKANEDPCFSMAALTTYLKLKNHYPVPINFDQQEIIMNKITDQIQMDWSDVLDAELLTIRDECSQSDTDFEMVIDSSGSVGQEDWSITMKMIGENWIKEIIVPNGSKYCGNHVAGRWFSTDTKRFHDFEPPSKEVYAPETYADYVGDIFVGYPYFKGSTHTGTALKAVREEDLPTARVQMLKVRICFDPFILTLYIFKFVMVFTDGGSNGGAPLESEADKLHQVADRVYAIGISDGINYNELHQIASKDSFVATLQDFSDLEAFARKFVKEQKGCYTEMKQAHRAIDLQTMTHYGMSWESAVDSADLTNPACKNDTVCPSEDESMRLQDCVTCSEQIGMFAVMF